MKNKIFQKICAVVTAVCFTLLIISPSTFASVSTSSQKSLDGIATSEIAKIPLNKNIQNSLISSKYGKVISINDKNSDTVVINIQDLHCDYSVQKNIYSIIDELCEKYNIENVYAEGGIGTIEPGIFANLNPAYKKTVLENLLKSGRLTGTEYYSLLNDKQGFLKGIEDEKIYNENIVRLSKILKSKPDTQEYLSNIDREVYFLKAKYLTSKNKKFNTLLDKYENKKISQKEFLSKLFTIAADNDINTKKYKNLQGYFSLTLSSSDINKKSLTKEFASLLSEIKNNVSYDEYKKVLSLTSNFTNFSSTKMVMENYCNNKKINVAKVYPNVDRFLSLQKDSLNINPIAMVKEERKLVDTIRTYLSETQTELEIAYISDFKDFYKKFVTAELTSAQWEYVKIGLSKFEELYAKYSVQNDVSKLKKHYSLLTDFYNVNTERNSIFLKNMHILSSSNPPIFQSSKLPDFLSSAKKILILVSGGYHTEGITELLNKNNISNITITPEVINAAASTRAVYENLVANQVMSLRQMIALGLITNAKEKEQLSAVLLSMFPRDSHALDNVNVNMLATHLNQVFSQKVSFSVLSDGKTIEAAFADGTKQTIDVPVAAVNAALDMGHYEELTAGTGEFRQVTEESKIKEWEDLLTKTSLRFGQDIFAPEVYEISKGIFVWVVKNGFYQGNGASYRIAISNYNGRSLDGVEPIIYEYMPEVVQNSLLVKQQKQDEIKKSKSSIIKAARDMIKKFLLFVMALVLALSMAACSTVNNNVTDQSQIETAIQQTSKSDMVLSEEYEMFNERIEGYLDTFYAGNGKYNSFTYSNMDMNKVFVNNTAASIQNLYDQALAALSLMQIGDRAGAERVLNTISSNGTFYKSNLERYQVTGEMVWVGIAAVQYKLLTGTTRYDSLIEEIDNYLAYAHKKDGGYYGQTGHNWISTEHMLDVVAYLNLKSQYDDSEQIKQDLESAAAFIYNNLYNAEKGGFYRGYKDEGYVLDTNAWGIQVLMALKDYNPEIYDRSGLANIDINRLLEFSEQFKATQVPEQYKNLYVWSLDAGSSVSFEWSMEMAVSYELLGQYEKAQAIVDDCIAYSKELGAYSDYIVYTNKDGLNYIDGWDAHVVNALCATVGQQTQYKYGVSYFWFLKKIDGVDYTSEVQNLSNVNFIMEEDYNWRTYATDKVLDLTDVTDITIRMKLKEIPQNFDPKVRIRFLPRDPNAIQDLTNIVDFGVLRHDYTFDENGELVLNLNLDDDVWMELCGTTYKPRLKEVLMDYEHMRIIVVAGQYSFNYRLNDGKLDLDISIEFYNNGEPVTFFNDGTASDSSILPTTFKKINNLIAKGSATTLNILKTIIKAETGFSFFKPLDFIKAHPSDNEGARKLSEITIASKIMSLCLTALVSTFLISTGMGIVLSVLLSVGAFVASMMAALFVNVAVHTVMDFRFIKASGLHEAIFLYGKDRVSFNEDGTLAVAPVVSSQSSEQSLSSEDGTVRFTIKGSYGNRSPISKSAISENLIQKSVARRSVQPLITFTTPSPVSSVFVLNETPENAELYNFESVPVRIKTEAGRGTRCFIGKYMGSTIVLAEGAKYEDIMTTLKKAPYFQVMFGHTGTYDVIAVDMDNQSREMEYTEDGTIVIGADILKTGEYFDFDKEAVLIANKKIDAVTVNQNVAVFIDDSADTVSSPEDLVSTVNSFVKSDGLGTSAKVLFSSAYIDKVISLLEQKIGNSEQAKTEFLKIIKQLKDNNIEISIVFEPVNGVYVSEDMNFRKYFDYGIFTYIAGDMYFDEVSKTQTRVRMISDLNKIESFDGSLSVLRISQFKDEIDMTSGIFAFLNSAINIKQIMANRKIEFVKQAASNFAFDQIPEISDDIVKNVILSDNKNKFGMLSQYLDSNSQISVYYLTLKENEKEVFVEEILKRILAVNYMRQNGIKHGLREHNIEILLANALYQSVIPESTILSSPKVFVGDLAVNRDSGISQDLSQESRSAVSSSALTRTFIASQLEAFTETVPKMSAMEADHALKELLTRLTPFAFEQNDPEAITAIIDLIPLYADKNIAPLDAESVDFINNDSLSGLRAVLAAA